MMLVNDNDVLKYSNLEKKLTTASNVSYRESVI